MASPHISPPARIGFSTPFPGLSRALPMLLLALALACGCSSEPAPGGAAGGAQPAPGAGDAAVADGGGAAGPDAEPAAPSDPGAAAAQSAPVPEGGELKVLQFIPEGDVQSFTQAVVMFNQPMVPLGGLEEADPSLLTVDPPLPGKLVWLNQFMLAFVPERPAFGSLGVRLTLSPDVKSLSGAVLGGEPRVASFRLPPLEIAYSYDATPSEPGLALRPVISVWFNQPVEPGGLEGKSFFVHGPDDALRKVPASWADPEAGSGAGKATRMLQASAGGDLPSDVPWRLVIERGASVAEGFPPIAEDVTAATGSTYGELTAELMDSREGRPVTSGEYALEAPERAFLTIHFSNPVRLSEGIDYIEMDPPLPSLDESRRIWKRVAGGADGSPPGAPAVAGGSPDAAAAAEEPPESALTLWNPFAPKTLYTVRVRKGMPDVYGQRLAEDRVFRIRTGEFTPKAVMDNPGGVLESAFPPVVPVTVYNLPRTRAFGKVLTDAEAAAFFTAWNAPFGRGPISYVPDSVRGWVDEVRWHGPGTAAAGITPRADSSRAPATEPLDLSALFAGREREGVLFAGVGDGDSLNFFQVTDLGLTAKIGREDSLLWVTRLSGGTPAPGASVKALDCEGKTLWTGETDGEGLARLPGGRELTERSAGGCRAGDGGKLRFYFAAAEGGDRVFWSLSWGQGFYMWDTGLDYKDFGSPLDDDFIQAFLLTSQPIYKPGETARLKIIARRALGDRLEESLGTDEARVVVRGPRGGFLHDGLARVSPLGTLALDLPIPADAQYGDYEVFVDLAPGKGRPADDIAVTWRGGPDSAWAGTVQVRYYRAPAFELAFRDLPGAAHPGDRVRLAAEGSYHYGGTLSGGEAAFELSYEPDWGFRPEGFADPDWIFTPLAALERDEEGGWNISPVPPGHAASGSSPVSASGESFFEAEIPRIPAKGPAVPLRYTASVTVTDADGRSVTGTGTFTSHPGDLYAGVRNSGYLAEAGKPFRASVVAVTPQGEIREGERIRVTLMRRTWSTARRLSPGGVYGLVSHLSESKVEELEVTSGPRPVEVELTPAAPGFHYVLAEVRDAEGRAAQAAAAFSAWGGGDASWLPRGDDGLELSADRREYRPGDTARILVQSPFREGTGLVTVERGGVRQARTFALESGAPLLEIPLSEEDSPAVYVSVLLVRGRLSAPAGRAGGDLGKPTFRRGYLTLKVVSDRDRLGVEVKPEAEELSPGEEARLRIRVTGPGGEPCTGCEVAVAAVDAGLVQIGGDGGFHPESEFWNDLPLRVRTAASLSAVAGRVDWERKGGPAAMPAGGGGYSPGGDPGVRKDFRSVAHFDPSLSLDVNGEAEVRFTLPDNLTTFRIFAVATGAGRATGTGEGKVLSTRDLVLRAALPNHLTAGDEFAASAVVSTRAGISGEATVSIRPEGGIELLEEAERTVEIGPGGSVEVSFRA
ncbi:MAG: hypothetical protein LBG06_04015, partial [Deltaproteobacteria bacterium]|nr:hypothetical protein [Deltaproteobacteria bacterium]